MGQSREQAGSAGVEEAGLETFRVSAGSEILLPFPNRLLLLSQSRNHTEYENEVSFTKAQVLRLGPQPQQRRH